MNNYTHYTVEITTETGSNFNKETFKESANLLIEGGNTSIDNILSFMDECGQVVKALRKAMKKDCRITIHFNRFDYRQETDSIINVRSAQNTTTPKELLENEGMYLIDDHHFGNADFWLDINTDLLEAFKEFADNKSYWHSDIAL